MIRTWSIPLDWKDKTALLIAALESDRPFTVCGTWMKRVSSAFRPFLASALAVPSRLAYSYSGESQVMTPILPLGHGAPGTCHLSLTSPSTVTA